MSEHSSSQGWVYIVTNPALPELVKVGYTARQDVEKRIKEFNQAGLPYPYSVAYKVWVPEPQKLEKRVHQFLANERENKEWFRCSVGLAKEAIDHLAPSHTAQWTVHEKAATPELNDFSDSGECWPGYSEEPNPCPAQTPSNVAFYDWKTDRHLLRKIALTTFSLSVLVYVLSLALE